MTCRPRSLMTILRLACVLALSTIASNAIAAVPKPPARNTIGIVGTQARAQDKAQRKQLSEASQPAPAGAADAAAIEAPEPVVITAEEAAEIGPGGKRMTATRTPQRPIIDGVVDDDVWEFAEVVADMLQREPVDGGTPSQRTEVRILFDDENIYVGFINYDDHPDQIIASDLKRDSRLATDDTIAVIFDTFHDHRNGFLFRVNPLGTRYDATVKDERDINSQWDERWNAAAKITERGWEAEMEIPWGALRYRSGSHVWGVDFKREIRRANEEINWSNYHRGYDFRNVSQSGHLVGFRRLRLTNRFRVKPYMAGGYSAFNATSDPLRDGDGDFGLEDLKVQLTSNLTADVTINTDFAQVEDDQERVNLTRFPLFFPERREFFLEGADKFQFGAGQGHRGPDVLLYHSRRIGLASGSPVPMRVGAKVTGKMGSTSIGFINAQTGDALDVGYLGRNYTALRLKQDVLDRSSVGLIFTNVAGGGDSNRVAGVDGNFRFLKYLSVNGYLAQATDSGVDGKQYVGSFGAGWNSDLWSANASYKYVDPEFVTDIGFVRRRDQAAQSYSVGVSPRPGLDWLRKVWVNASVNYIADTSGEIETRNQTLWTRFQLESGDAATFSVTRNFERLQNGFYSSGLVWINPGDYTFDTWNASVETYRARKVSGRLSGSGGSFWGGSRSSYGGRVTVRFNEKLALTPSYTFNSIDLPNGSFNTHLATMRGSYNFSDRWLTSALVQYNSVAERMSVFVRLNYIHNNNDDFFLVFKSAVMFDDVFYGRTDSAVVAKVTRSWDF